MPRLSKKSKTIEHDYTKMELGTVIARYPNGATHTIARCPKCGKRGRRSVSIPRAEDAFRGRKPAVHVTHIDRYRDVNLGGLGIRDHDYIEGGSCTVRLNSANVDDLLNVAERKRYDALIAAWRAILAEYDPEVTK